MVNLICINVSLLVQIAYLNALQYGLKRILFSGFFIRGHAYTMDTMSFAINFWYVTFFFACPDCIFECSSVSPEAYILWGIFHSRSGRYDGQNVRCYQLLVWLLLVESID